MYTVLRRSGIKKKEVNKRKIDNREYNEATGEKRFETKDTTRGQKEAKGVHPAA